MLEYEIKSVSDAKLMQEKLKDCVVKEVSITNDDKGFQIDFTNGSILHVDATIAEAGVDAELKLELWVK